MTSIRDQWGGASRNVLACLLERPEWAERVEPKVVAPGPCRDLLRLQRSRLAQGLAADRAAMREAGEHGALVIELALGDHLQAYFPRYLAEARHEAARDHLRRVVDEGFDPEEVRSALALGGESRNGSGPVEARPLALDFDRPAPPPRDVVRGMGARGSVMLAVGDTGTAKTILVGDLIRATLGGSPWLGSVPVHGERILVVDEENPTDLIRARLKALGITNDHRDRLRYFCREGIRVGDDAWNDWLRDQAREHRADVLVIDTAMAATTVDAMDNDSIVRLYRVLRSIAVELDLLVVLLHHERKPKEGVGRSSGMATLGGRQWIGQADTAFELTRADDGTTTERPLMGGSVIVTTRVSLRAVKERDARGFRARDVVVRSERVDDPDRDDDGVLLSMVVTSDAAVPAVDATRERARTLRAAIDRAGGPLRSGDLARLLTDTTGQPCSTSHGMYTRARDHAVKEGWISEAGRGTYVAGQEVPE